MSLIKKIATASVVAAAGLGVAAANASAVTGITGGPHYTGVATQTHTFTVAEFYTIECPAEDTTFTGDVDGSVTTSFTPYYGGEDACSFFGFPATVEQDGEWDITLTSGPDGSGNYNGTIHIPSGTSTTISVPIVGCNVTVSGTQSFAHGSGGNIGQARNWGSGTGVDLEATVNGVSYTASGCPFSSGSDGAYSTNGVVSIPGITIS